MISSKRPIVFEQSKITQFGLFIGSLAFAAACLYIVIFMKNLIGAGSLKEFMLWCGGVFFSGTAVLWLWQLLTLRGPVVVITDTGITDRRVTAEEVPWQSITALGEVVLHGTPLIVLQVAPETLAGLTLTGVARWSAGPNRALGIDGLCVATTGLKCDHDMLVSLCHMHLERAHGEAVTLTA